MSPLFIPLDAGSGSSNVLAADWVSHSWGYRDI